MAAPSSFFDPFAITPSKLLQKPGGPLRVPEKSSKSHNISYHTPPAADNKLIVKGQGTVAVKATVSNTLLFIVKTANLGSPNLYLQIGLDSCELFYGDVNDPNIPKKVIEVDVLKNKNSTYVVPEIETTYWLSIDNKNGILSYGKYFTSKNMGLIQAVLKVRDPEKRLLVWKDDKEYAWLDGLTDVEIVMDDGKIQPKVQILALPVVIQLSPFVIAEDQISLLQLERGDFTTPVNLPEACQVLYGNVAGPNITLDTPDFPDFSAAIQRSCEWEGGLGHKLLAAKSKEFGDKVNFEGTYLRITLGYNLGDSPGIPYVLEIWPSGHYSPIHDHGRANAVIKVLHGRIQATFFDSLQPPGPHPLGPAAELTKNMITWISPSNYQIHQLHNRSDDVCCTIQCYRYEDQDNVHYDGFDYLRDDGKVDEFIPDSDMAFTQFRDAIRREWYEWQLTKLGSAGGH